MPDIRIAVCDDCREDRDRACEMSRAILERSGFAPEFFCYGSAEELLRDIRKNVGFQLILLDVVMDEMDGMELAAQLRRQGDKTAIIFISGNREMAMRGYEVAAMRFLAKPLDKKKLEEALTHCCKGLQAKKEILLATQKGQYRISFEDIAYVEAFDRGTRFVLTDETVETKLKFAEVEVLLPKSVFTVCHRAYIVNMAQTKRINPYEFVMRSGAVVPISRLRYSEVNRQFVTYLMD